MTTNKDKLMVSVSGIRGRAGSALGPREAFNFGCAYGTILGPGSTVALGMDTRLSGTMIKNSVTSGLLACGVNVVYLGIVTTPGTGVMTIELECDGGVVITASHNPGDQNGIKFLQPSGAAQPADVMMKIEEVRQSGRFAFQEGFDVGQETSSGRTHRIHIDKTLPLVDVTGISSRRFRVVLDSINGAGCVGVSTLLSKLGCEIIHINGEPNGEFAHQPEPIKEHLADLCNAVRDNKADVGFALDPDGDRLVVVDETGNFPGEEYTLALSTLYVLSHRKGKIATNLSTSRMIDDIAAKFGSEVVRTPTGEANVVAGILNEDCIFGGEGNGGVIEPRVSYVRDSFVGIAYILQLLFETQKTISELISEIPAYQISKTKLPIPDNADDALNAIKECFINEPGIRIDESDGFRADTADSWILARKSNTEPIIRVFAEAPTLSAADDLIDKAMAAINA